jgi:hypothetical protein
MLNETTVSTWLGNYVSAWKSYDPQAIGDLFSQDAAYYYTPYGEPLRGRDAIIADWLKNPDAPGTYDGQYHPIAVEGNTAVANGRSYYFEADGKTPKREFDNIFVLRFDDEGRCAEFREWFMEKPQK